MLYVCVHVDFFTKFVLVLMSRLVNHLKINIIPVLNAKHSVGHYVLKNCSQ